MEKQVNHYVPKFYLRLFSGNKNFIAKYMFEQNKMISHSSIDDTGGKYGLYGSNSNGIEKWFMNRENDWSVAIKKVVEKEMIDPNDYGLLLSFLVYSDNRTLKQADRQNEIVTQQVQAYIRIYRDQGEIDISDEEIESIKISYDIPIAHPYNVSCDLVDCCRDLNIGLIKNTSEIEFITSDNPVAKYNYLYVKKGYFRPFGYCHRGVIFLFPLTPRLCLMVYDDVTYVVIGFVNGVINIDDEKEILKLNRLFVNVAYKEIYLPNDTDNATIEKLKSYRTSQKHSPLKILHSKNAQLHIRQAETFFEDLDLNFLIPKEEYLKMNYPADMGGLMRPTTIC